MFVVMILVNEYSANGLDARFQSPCIGVLPVYPTRKDAENDWPGRPIMEIEEVRK